MGSISGLRVAASGLNTARSGLNAVGHNMANDNTEGYVRQRIIQKDAFYVNKGNGPKNKLLVGQGSDVLRTQQLRDEFIDIAYRDEVSKGSFYTTKMEAGQEIEQILGELQSEYNAHSVITDMWDAVNELSVYQPGLETRANFVSTSVSFINKVNNISERLFEYQHNLDQQLRESVVRVNQLLGEISELNDRIVVAEISGDSANDFRDSRNKALDELSQHMKIDCKEKADGSIDILSEGNDLLVANDINRIGLKYTGYGYSFVEPVFTSATEILPYDAPTTTYKTVFKFTEEVNSKNANDVGKMKGILVARGFYHGNYATNTDRPDPTDNIKYPMGVNDPNYQENYKIYFNATQATIPRIQREFDTIVNNIVTSINDKVAPKIQGGANDPVALDGVTKYNEIFVRNKMDRYTGTTYNAENPEDYYSLYTIGNISVNPMFLNTDGYSKIALSYSGDYEDNNVPLDIMEDWKNTNIALVAGGDLFSIDDAYNQFVNGVGTSTKESLSFSKEQERLTTQIANKRQELSGVAIDEEMSNMLTYQHAYNAAAKVITVIDSMLNKLINETGRSV